MPLREYEHLYRKWFGKPVPDDVTSIEGRCRPDQEKNWPAFEQALRSRAKDRIDRMQARAAAPPQPVTDPVEGLKRAADAATRRGAALKQLADAAAPLYQSLDDAQKNRFRILAHFGHRRHIGGHMGGHRHFASDGAR